MLGEKRFCIFNYFMDPFDKDILIQRGIDAYTAPINRVIRQSLSECFDDADIIHDQPVAFPLGNTVCASNRLHQRVRL